MISKILYSYLKDQESYEHSKMMILTVVLVFGLSLVIITFSGNNSQKMSKEFPLQFRLAAQFRIPILMFIVIPLSYVRWLHTTICDWYRYHLMKPKDSHHDRVQNIVKQVKLWNQNGRKSIMRTARPNWASMSTKLSSNKGDANKISTHELTHILNVDEKNIC